MSLMQRIVDMQFQLQEAEDNGELDLFIADQHKDLNALLTSTMHVLQLAADAARRI